MKASFRVWKDLEPEIQRRLDKYPPSFDLTTKWNSLLKDLLGGFQTPAPLPTTKPQPPPDAPFICMRGFKKEPSAEGQKVKCSTCQLGDFSMWRACMEQRDEERQKAMRIKVV